MIKPNIVSKEQWLQARTALLEKEKAHTKLRDDLSRQRRELPWVKIDQDYRFDGSQGENTLAELFEGKRQLVVYHFMFGPDWQEGCPSCSFWADQYDRAVPHLRQRDTQLVAISRAPLEMLLAYRQRMGWTFNWVSSLNSSFNFDFEVSFSDEGNQNSSGEKTPGKVHYNYRESDYFSAEAPGVSIFVRDDDGSIYHTYSAYARGLDAINGSYQILDLTPRGRQEEELPFPIAWVKRRDCYED